MENTPQNDVTSNTIDGVNVEPGKQILFKTLEAGEGITVTDGGTGMITISRDDEWKPRPRIRQCYE